MSKRKKFIAILVTAGGIWLMVYLFSYPLMNTEAGIRRHLLRITPIGTSVEDVISVLERRRGWGWVIGAKRNQGVVLDRGIPLGGALSAATTVVGEQSIRVYLGRAVAYVGAFYAFDENGELIEIFVRKEWW